MTFNRVTLNRLIRCKLFYDPLNNSIKENVMAKHMLKNKAAVILQIVVFFIILLSSLAWGASELNEQQERKGPTRPPQLKYQSILTDNTLAEKNVRATSSAVDIVFAIDNTGSMGGTINTVKSDVQTITDNIRSSVSDSRFGSIKFQDYGDIYITQIVNQPTADITAFKTAINTMYADYGGDWPEAYVEAVIQGANDISWRTSALKLLVVLGDAPPHDPVYGTGVSGSGKSWSNAATEAINKGVVVSMIAVGYGVGNTTVYNSYNYMATATSGKYIESSNPTEVSNAIIDLINSLSGSKPMVVETNPLAGATDVPVTSAIRIKFNMDMDPSTINYETVRIDDSWMITFITYDASSKTVTIVPAPPRIFSNNRTYTITLGNGIKAATGEYLSLYTFSFTTQPESPRLRVTKALRDFEEKAVIAIDEQGSLAATLISEAASSLLADEISTIIRDIASVAVDLRVFAKHGAQIFNYRPRAGIGISPSLAHKLAIMRDIKKADTFKLAWKLLKLEMHMRSLETIVGSIRKKNDVLGYLNNSYPHYICSETADNDCTIAYTGIKGIKDKIHSMIDNTILSIPESISDSNANKIDLILRKAGNDLAVSRIKEVFPRCPLGASTCSSEGVALGHINGFKDQLESAKDALLAEELGKWALFVAKTSGAILKAGGVGALFTVAGAPVGVAGFALGQKLFWGATIADIAWTVADGFDLYLSPSDLIQDIIAEVSDNLDDADQIMLAFIEDTLSAVNNAKSSLRVAGDRIAFATGPGTVTIDSFTAPNIDMSVSTQGTAQLIVRNTGGNIIRCSVQGLLDGPQTQNAGKALFGIVGADTKDIPAGSTATFTVGFSGLPLIFSGAGGNQLSVQLHVSDPSSGESWIEGPFAKMFYVFMNAVEGNSLSSVSQIKAASGSVTPGIIQETLISIPANLQSVVFSLIAQEGTDVDLHLVDASGKHVGMNYATGLVEKNIPGSDYSGAAVKVEFISVTNPVTGTYILRVIGRSGDAKFNINRVDIPNTLPAILATSDLINVSAVMGTTATASLDVREIGGSQDVSGLTLTNGALSDGLGHEIAGKNISFGSYANTISKGTSIGVPITVSVPSGLPAGVYNGTITVQSSVGTNIVPISVTILSLPGTQLSNGVALNQTMTAPVWLGTTEYYYIDLPSGSSNLVIDLYNLTGDLDLYVMQGSKPTLSIYDCASTWGGSISGICFFNSPASGRWWIGVTNWDTGTFSYTIKASWNAGCSGDVIVLQNMTFKSGNTYNCTATTSITAGTGVTVQNGATVNFRAPKINLQPGFKVESGAVFSAKQ